MTEERKLLCRTGGMVVRQSVYLVPDGLDFDSTESYEVVRRRVLYDDVSLVTYHSDHGFWYLLFTAIVGGLFSTLGMLVVGAGTDAWPASIVFFVFGIPALILFFVRLIFGRAVITVFGRRSKAVLRFGGLRKRRAREIYGEICAAVRRVQTAAQQAEDAAAPAAVPVPVDVPMPPFEQP